MAVPVIFLHTKSGRPFAVHCGDIGAHWDVGTETFCTIKGKVEVVRETAKEIDRLKREA